MIDWTTIIIMKGMENPRDWYAVNTRVKNPTTTAEK